MQKSQNSDTGVAVRHSISVFFPCYNERENIEALTTKAIGVLEEMNTDYEVIIVNDGSSDGTKEVIDALCEKFANVRAVHHETNKGYGAALQSGFRNARKELVFYTDGDGQFDIGELPKLMPVIEECDIVSCYRINRRDNLIRKINGFCWSTLGSVLFGLGIKDVDCAFKLYKRRIFDEIEMHSTGALIDTEILARAKKKGYTIRQVGVMHYPRMAGTQTGANPAVILRAFLELFRLYSRIRKSG